MLRSLAQTITTITISTTTQTKKWPATMPTINKMTVTEMSLALQAAKAKEKATETVMGSRVVTVLSAWITFKSPPPS